MEERTISLVVASLDELHPVSQKVDDLFHMRLLDTCPEIYRLFAMDIEPHERRLFHALGLILGQVRHVGAIAPTVAMLARSQKLFRLIDAHYEALAQTLVWTLRRVLGDSFTIETERAWWSALWDRRHASELDEPVVVQENDQPRAPWVSFNNCSAMRRVIPN
ncbi:hypothetical protein CN878_23705 [Ochrobactrum sp. 695/2009]|nr:globin domain-containing protein [Brucella intermedia]PJR92492.1 hypothetical protein CN881_08065 [Ochrobactrum sp. 721/2009]PJT13570.1 hypothetical protein CN880_23490 [Ochrobactrum sp. 720/2009]PJT18077.1 hypothetical protein CN879_23750 [Ochrobactrum sp. 715/2009]PJT21783.1 hypothetical protein CN878_23705 [Ochrobactrum sp. 695/2009]PJT31792.1 hypothetical protein CN877_23750 [Ochrobactrum sp. 689/2009]